jgi:hypothetical protein
MTTEKLKPIKDILAEVLDEVDPVLNFQVGDKLFECWKPDHITEAHNMRFVSVQVELMVLGRQYVAITEELNRISNQPELSTEEKIKINELSQAMIAKVTEMLPLNVAYIEAVTESKAGSFLGVLKEELNKRSPRKQVPIALFVNTIKEQINKALEKAAEDKELRDMGKEVLLMKPQENLPERQQTPILEAA